MPYLNDIAIPLVLILLLAPISASLAGISVEPELAAIFLVLVAIASIVLLLVAILEPQPASEKLVEDLIREGSKGGWERIARLEKKQDEKKMREERGWRETRGLIFEIEEEAIDYDEKVVR
jgi:hypothetical protein